MHQYVKKRVQDITKYGHTEYGVLYVGMVIMFSTFLSLLSQLWCQC